MSDSKGISVKKVDLNVEFNKLVDEKVRNVQKEFEKKLTESRNQGSAFQARIKDLEAKVQDLTVSHATAMRNAAEDTHKATIKLASANKQVGILTRKIDELQKSSADKDKKIAELTELLAKEKMAPKAEEVKPTNIRIRRSKTSGIRGLKPGAGLAVGS